MRLSSWLAGAFACAVLAGDAASGQEVPRSPLVERVFGRLAGGFSTSLSPGGGLEIRDGHGAVVSVIRLVSVEREHLNGQAATVLDSSWGSVDERARAPVAIRGGAGVREWWQEFDGTTAAHGVMIDALPPGDDGIMLRFAWEACSGAAPLVEADAIVVPLPSGNLRYDALAAFDGDGSLLPARFAACAGGFVIHVALPAQAAAALPITVDPLLAYQDAELILAAPAGGDRYGRALALEGNRLLVGAPEHDPNGTGRRGAVFHYERMGSPSAVWTLQSGVLFPPDAGTGDMFGTSLALEGNTLAIGAPRGPLAASKKGLVYVYLWNGSAWQLEGPELDPGLGPAPTEIQFGHSVALSGDRLVGGARDYYPSGASQSTHHGAAFVFERNAGTWTEQAILIGNDTALFDAFGTAVAIVGTTVVVGAPGNDSVRNDEGAAYVFEFNSGAGTWGQTQKLVASDASGSDAFGSALAIDGDTLAIGAPFGDRGTAGVGSGKTGAVYVFTRPMGGGPWTQVAKLLAGDRTPGDRFGTAVALDGDRLAVGAPFNRYGLGIKGGAVYVFERSGGAWTQAAKMLPTTPALLDEFGGAVGISGDTVASGAWRRDVGAELDQGAVFLHELESFGTPTTMGAFCFGDGGNQMGCTDCPCGNNAPIGSGTGCMHSLGRGALVEASGTASVLADTLRFEVAGAVPNSFGILLSADARLPMSAANPCFGLDTGIQAPGVFDGLRCIGTNLFRHGSRASDGDGNIGRVTAGWGPPNNPMGGLIGAAAANGGINFVANTTKHFFVEYRDSPLLGCMTGLNTTNAVSIDIIP